MLLIELGIRPRLRPQHDVWTWFMLVRAAGILRQLKHENIIDIMEIFIPQEYKGFSDVYVVSSLMETDLTCAGDCVWVSGSLLLQT